MKDFGYYVKGYCEIEQGRVEFKGRMNGVSHAQVRFHLIYALRKEFNIRCWINPIFEMCTYLTSDNLLKTDKLHCILKEYDDGLNRHFIRFSEYEASRLDKLREEDISDIKLEFNTLPDFKEADRLEPFVELIKESIEINYPKFEEYSASKLDENVNMSKISRLCTFYNSFGEDYRELEKKYEFFHSSHVGHGDDKPKELYDIIGKNKNYKIVRVEEFEGAFVPGGEFYYFDFLIYYDKNGNLIKPFYIKQREEEFDSLLRGIAIVQDDYLIGVSGDYNEDNDVMTYVIKYNNMYKEFMVEDISIKMKNINSKCSLNKEVLLKLLEESEEYKTYIGIKILQDVCELSGIENIQHETNYEDDLDNFYNYEEDTSCMVYCSEDGRYHDAEDAWMYDGSCD